MSLLNCGLLPFQIHKNITYKEINGAPIQGDLYLPNADTLKEAVLVIHGGSWSSRNGGMSFICWMLALSGFAVFNVTYRLAPKDLYPKAVEDVRDALNYLKQHSSKYQIDPQRISTWGYSAGGHLALLLGLDPENKIRKIIAGAAPADFLAWPKSPIVGRFLGYTLDERKDLWEEASPIHRVSSNSPPVFLYHGMNDTLVEVEQTYKMQAALQQKSIPVKVHLVPYLGHVLLYVLGLKSIREGIRFLKTTQPERSFDPPAV